MAAMIVLRNRLRGTSTARVRKFVNPVQSDDCCEILAEEIDDLRLLSAKLTSKYLSTQM